MGLANTIKSAKQGSMAPHSIQICLASDMEESPMSQNRMLCSRKSWVSETRNMIIDEQNALTMTLARINPSFLMVVLVD
jgi:hypothetical protein